MHGLLPSFSFRARALLACVPVAGLVMLAGAGAASAAHAPVNTRAAARAALEHFLAGWHPANHAVGGHVVLGTGLKQVKSSNWSGYADDNSTGKTYSKVTGKWAEPAGKCTSVQSLAVFFVGIDGFSSKTVEQAGTLIFCNGGSPTYFTWWEMFPSNAVQVVGSTVAPGDLIAASVAKSSTTYTLKVTDSTHPANSFTTTQTCAATTCKDTSTEWIAERPSGTSGLFPLTNFGTWTLKSATVKSGTTTGTISSFPDDEITMVDSSLKVLAKPGALNATGNQFKDVWKAST